MPIADRCPSPVLSVDDEIHGWLLDNPGVELELNIADASLTLPDGRIVTFPIDDFARYCLLEGIDQLGFLQNHLGDIVEFEEQRQWKP